MRLFELFDLDFAHLEQNLEHIDGRYNREVYEQRKKQEEYYKKTGMNNSDSTPVFTKPAEPEIEEIWTTKPKYPRNRYHTSPGYTGRENAKRRAGHSYDKRTPQADPHSEVAIPGDEADLIKQADRSLGRHLFK